MSYPARAEGLVNIYKSIRLYKKCALIYAVSSTFIKCKYLLNIFIWLTDEIPAINTISGQRRCGINSNEGELHTLQITKPGTLQ